MAGNLDTAGALIIDPSNDPQVHGESAKYGIDLATIDRMPVTKRVTKVTLGDLGERADCQGYQPSVMLSVTESRTQRLDDATIVATSVNEEILPPGPGKVTWDIPATTFYAGRSYTFQISNQAGGCGSAFSIRTWAHNMPTVNGGPGPCDYFDASNQQSYNRVWHESGQDDWTCTIPPRSSNFDSTLPSGWLLVGGYNENVLTELRMPDGTIYQSNCYFGTTAVYWREPSGLPGWSEYACVFPEFTSPHNTVDDGWYYGVSYDSGSALSWPRDIYVKLDTIDYDGLLKRYSPVLQYDSAEPYPAEPAEMMPSYAAGTCGSATGSEWRNSLWADGDQQIPLASADQCGGLPELNASWLVPDGATYPTSMNRALSASTSDHLDESDDNYLEASGHIYNAAAAERVIGDTVYARAYQSSDGAVWLEYWIWYYYNNGENRESIDNHEGDWEHIDLRLGEDLTPVKAVYGEHTYASRCDWSDVEQSDDRPVVYVARGRHASWFAPGTFGDYDDRNDGLGARVTPSVELVTSGAPSWISWPGRWGSTNFDVGGPLETRSPPGPAFQSPWNNPSDEEAGARTGNCPQQMAALRTGSAASLRSAAVGRGAGLPAAAVGGHRLHPPRITIATGRGYVRVVYVLSREGGPRNLLLSVRRRSNSLSEVKTVSVRRKRAGVAYLMLPPGRGPYVFSASVMGRAIRSPTIQRTLR